MGVTSGFQGNEAASPHFVLLLQGMLGALACSLLLAFGETPSAAMTGCGGRHDTVGAQSTHPTDWVPIRTWFIVPPKTRAGRTFSLTILISSFLAASSMKSPSRPLRRVPCRPGLPGTPHCMWTA